MVQVRAPNGKVKLIPADQVEAALAAGGKRVQGLVNRREAERKLCLTNL